MSLGDACQNGGAKTFINKGVNDRWADTLIRGKTNTGTRWHAYGKA